MIDTTYIAERLAALPASDRELGRQLGVSSPTVQRIRDALNHEDLTVRMLGRIGDVLGADLAIVPVAPNGSAGAPPTSDSAAVEAALLLRGDAVPVAELAAILGWRRQRVLTAADQLQQRLASSGARLHRDRNGLAIRPRAGLLDRDDERALFRQRYQRRGLTLTVARVLHDVLQDNVDGAWLQHASNAQRVALAELINAGLAVRRADGRVTPSRALSISRRLTRPTACTTRSRGVA